VSNPPPNDKQKAFEDFQRVHQNYALQVMAIGSEEAKWDSSRRIACWLMMLDDVHYERFGAEVVQPALKPDSAHNWKKLHAILDKGVFRLFGEQLDADPKHQSWLAGGSTVLVRALPIKLNGTEEWARISIKTAAGIQHELCPWDVAVKKTAHLQERAV
jgi:hypothetical protein